MTEGLRSDFMAGMDEIERAGDPNSWAASAGPSTSAKPEKKHSAPMATEDADAEDADADDAADDVDGPEETDQSDMADAEVAPTDGDAGEGESA